jgi:hypothetical protein
MTMKLLMIVAAWVAVAVLAREADAQEKTPKPVVCVAYRIVEPGLALCSDGKKPFVMSRFAEVSAPGKEAGSVKVLVGWR